MGATPKRTIRRTRRVTKGRTRKRPARRAKRVSVSRRNKKSRTTRTTLTRRGKGKQRAGSLLNPMALPSPSSFQPSLPPPINDESTDRDNPREYSHTVAADEVEAPMAAAPYMPPPYVVPPPHRLLGSDDFRSDDFRSGIQIKGQRKPVGGKSCGTDGSGAQCIMSGPEFEECERKTKEIMKYVQRPYTGIHCLHEYQLQEFEKSKVMGPPCHCELPRFDSQCTFPDTTIEWADYKTEERNLLEAVYLDDTCAYCEPTDPNYQTVYNTFLGIDCPIPNPNLLTKDECVEQINKSTSSLNRCADKILVSLIEVFGLVGAIGILCWCRDGCPTGGLRIGLTGIWGRLRGRVEGFEHVPAIDIVRDMEMDMEAQAQAPVVVVQQQPPAFNAAEEMQELRQAIGTKCDVPSIYEEECAICLEGLSAPSSLELPPGIRDRGDGSVVQTHCLSPHFFHFNCMMNLLMAGQERCPCCRHRLGLTRVQVSGLEPEPASASASASAPEPAPVISGPD